MENPESEEDDYDRFLNVCATVDMNLLQEAVLGNIEKIASIAGINVSDIDYLPDEHVFATYVNRIRKKKIITGEDIEFILGFRDKKYWSDIIDGFLGYLAADNYFREAQSYRALLEKYTDMTNHAYRQIMTRLLLMEKSGYSTDLIDKIIEYRTIWAFYEIIPELPGDILEYFINRLKNENVIYRSHRHDLREYIWKTLKILVL